MSSGSAGYSADIRRYRGLRSAAESCALEIVTWLGNAIDRNVTGKATLAISGGKSPEIMFEVFRGLPFRWDRVELFWVDERCVPPEHERSTFRMAKDVWLAPSGFPAANIHRIEGELEPSLAASRYQEEIQRVFTLAAGQLPRFDVIHRGMGADAHTASLFPGDPLIGNRSEIAAAVFAKPFEEWRVTLLPGVLAAAHRTAMLVTGKDKAEPLQQVLNGPYDPLRLPAQIGTRDVNLNGQAVVWFVDAAAAAAA